MATAKTDLAAAAASEFADLERLWYEMDWPPGSRVELIGGELVVSPTGSVWHSAAVDELMEQLFALKRRRGWAFHTNLTAHIPPTRERLIPDLMIAPKGSPPFSEWELLAPGGRGGLTIQPPPGPGAKAAGVRPGRRAALSANQPVCQPACGHSVQPAG
jgi:hypothetical protein